MFYLILKYAFLFVLAALLGFLFGRWWARRSFVDVTHDYVVMSRAAEAPWEKLWQRFNVLEKSVSEVRSDLPAGLEVVQGNLSEGIRRGFSSLRGTLDEMEAQVQAHPQRAAQVDLSSLEQRFAALEESLRQMPAAQVDLGDLQAQLSAVDLKPLDRRLDAIERALDSQQGPDLNRWLDVVEQALSSGAREPAEERLVRVEQAIALLSKPSAPGSGSKVKSKTAARARKQARRITSRGKEEPLARGIEAANLQLLDSPRFGSKDNLKLISGIGPKLERELNRQGVYYFWQVAEWKGAEIRAMDERLDAFRGRIERDGWVAQARQLMNDGHAAQRPND